MKRLLAALALLAFALPAFGQQVVTYPSGSFSTNSSGAIASSSAFQSVFAAAQDINSGRHGCVIQNNSTHTMYVYFGPITSATTPTSLQITAGQTASCTQGGVVSRDQVSIAGTSGDIFYANQQ